MDIINDLLNKYRQKEEEFKQVKQDFINECRNNNFTDAKIIYLLNKEKQIKNSIKWTAKKRGYVEGEIRKKGPKPKPKPPKEPKPRGRPKKIKTTDEETTEEKNQT